MTISSYLLILYAVLQVIGLIISLSMLGKTQDVYRELYEGTSAEGAETFASIAGVGGAIVGLLLAAGVVVLALLNNRGKNVSRIITWVVAGLAICCSGFGLASSALTDSMGGGAGGDAPSPAEIQRRLNEVLPSWYKPATTTLAVISLLALLAVVILLALPASNEFFRKRPENGWEPPLPGSAYPQPGVPGYPPAYPQTGAPGYQPGPPASPSAPSQGFGAQPPAPSGDPQAPSSAPPAPPSEPPAPPAQPPAPPAN